MYQRIKQKYFEIESNNKYYIMGLLWTDGCLDKALYGIELGLIDKELVEQVAKKLGQIKVNKRKNENFYEFGIRNKYMYFSLIKLGLTPKKSFTIQVPKLPKKYISHFLRGVFDGDGCINFDKSAKFWQFEIVSASKFFISQIQFLLQERDIESKIYQDGKYWELIINKNKELEKIYQLFYKGNTALYLKRKKRIFDIFHNLKTKCGGGDEHLWHYRNNKH